MICEDEYCYGRTTDSNGSNNSARGLSRIHPRMTMDGMTNNAVCYERCVSASCWIREVPGKWTYDSRSDSDADAQCELVFHRNVDGGDTLCMRTNK